VREKYALEFAIGDKEDELFGVYASICEVLAHSAFDLLRGFCSVFPIENYDDRIVAV
jgi:hypothetical protein